MKDPRVADCCVVGVYSEAEATELVTAFVQLSEEYARDHVDKEKVKREIQDLVDGQVPDPRKLRGGIYLVDSFQRTAYVSLCKYSDLNVELNPLRQAWQSEEKSPYRKIHQERVQVDDSTQHAIKQRRQ